MTIRDSGHVLTGDTKAKYLEDHGESRVEIPGDEEARTAVVNVCSSHRRSSLSVAQGWDEDVTALLISGDAHKLAKVVDMPDVYPGPCLSAPAMWSGELGVAVAARCGVRYEPEAEGVPDLSPDDRKKLVQWLVAGDLDLLLERGFLQRGLALGCGECNKVSFSPSTT